jgi:EAL domain-containing protein (putative c-di-GMP-specific phosphodiesterase class I)
LAESGLAPERLELELTETQLMQNAEMLAPVLQRLRDAGIGLAMDDFGIGYCGLNYIRAFPFSKLKIDQSFVRSILVTARDAALTGAVINLATGLQMDVVAECVETADQALRLQSLGCKVVQGYLASRPVAADVLEERFLQAQCSPGPLVMASGAAGVEATAC